MRHPARGNPPADLEAMNQNHKLNLWIECAHVTAIAGEARLQASQAKLTKRGLLQLALAAQFFVGGDIHGPSLPRTGGLARAKFHGYTLPMSSLGRYFIPAGVLLCLWPQINSAEALLLGVGLALLFTNPYLPQTRAWTPKLLQAAVIGLGAGMNLMTVARVGMHGIGYTVLGISFTMALGLLLARWLKTSRDISLLITTGTAICGGSAIAALAPTIRAKPHDVSVSLATVFLLNALALLIFPGFGHALELSQQQFGLWAALAIHDTSSVVGASMQFGAQALEVGTTVKLARALWIVPLTLAIGYWVNRKADSVSDVKAKKPWFILGFLLAAALVTWVPSLSEPGHWVEWIAKRIMVLTLFLIGASLTRESLRAVGIRPLVLGVVLWIVTASVSLTAIVQGWIGV